MPAVRTTPWNEIEREYVESPLKLSHSYLAEKYGLNQTTVTRRSSKGDWVEKRKTYQERAMSMPEHSRPGGAPPPVPYSPAERAKRERIAHLTEIIESLQVKLKPTNVVKDGKGKVVKFEYDVPPPFTNVGMLLRQLTDMTKLRDDLESSLPPPKEGRDPSDPGSLSAETEIERVRKIAKRVVENEPLLDAGREVVERTDADGERSREEAEGDKKPEEPAVPEGAEGDDVDAALEALVNGTDEGGE